MKNSITWMIDQEREVKMERVQVSREVLNVILSYLSNKPYKEVAALIKALQDDLAKNQEASNESQD